MPIREAPSTSATQAGCHPYGRPHPVGGPVLPRVRCRERRAAIRDAGVGTRFELWSRGRLLRQRSGRRSSTRRRSDRPWPQPGRHAVPGRGVRRHREPRARRIRQCDIRPSRPRGESASGRWPPPVGPLWRSGAYILAGPRRRQERRTNRHRLHGHAALQRRRRTRHPSDRNLGPRRERHGGQGAFKGVPLGDIPAGGTGRHSRALLDLDAASVRLNVGFSWWP